MSAETLIICEECDRPESEPHYERANWKDGGHPFVRKVVRAEARSRSAAPVRKMTPADGPPCVDCGKPKRSHRGRHCDHRYHAPGAPPPRPSKAQLRAQRKAGKVPKPRRTARRASKKRTAAAAPAVDRRSDVRGIVDIASEIDELRNQLEEKVAELKRILQ